MSNWYCDLCIRIDTRQRVIDLNINRRNRVFWRVY
jgi:hypothetical protein